MPVNFIQSPSRCLQAASSAVVLLVFGWGSRASAHTELRAASGDEVVEDGAPLEDEGVAPPSTRPPELKDFVETPYPAEALQARVEGRVVLKLTITASGNVTEAEVVEGLGYGLDDAARAAALRFVFTPATQGGEPRAARILYGYEFRLPARSVPEPEAVVQVSPDAKIEEAPPLLPAEVVVRGYREEDELVRSTAAVTVVDLKQASRESSDLGEVLARVEGVNVQRVGGLGSPARFSLAGFDDTQVRFFIDGIPLEFQGFSLGIQNVPLSLGRRVDVYKGVVPVRLGADSLGGAFDLITDRSTIGTKAAGSYQLGSFETHRLTASARHLDDRSGFFIKGEGFYDTTQNDYPVVVKVPDKRGQEVEVTRDRLHDAYQAGGGNVELGFVNRKWADRLLLKVYAAQHDKELQHNPLMTLPYGEAKYDGFSSGINLRYEGDFGDGLSGTFVSGYAYETTDFLDNPSCVYDWDSRCIIEKVGQGEVQSTPADRTIQDHTGYLRWNLTWALAAGHEIVMSTAPTYFTRTGEDHLRRDTSRLNTLRAKRESFQWVSGVEYTADLLDQRLENSFFVKNYLFAAQSVEIYNEYVATPMNSQELYWGVGDGVRYALNDWALWKASYEYAVRLPEPVELFGNSVQVIENLELHPERSHNVNLTFLINRLETRHGNYDANVTGFYRGAQDLILLIGRADVFRYENAYRANVYGVEGGGSWISPGEYLELGANATLQEYRNRSEEGEFQEFAGDRIPNKPYFFANAHVRLRKQGTMVECDELSFSWYTRYTHSFLRAWESVGSQYVQPEVPSQLVHTAVLAYLIQGKNHEELSFSLEAQNVTDEMVYDFYRVQKPGRAFYFKTQFIY